MSEILNAVNKVMGGGIIFGLQKAFDCVNHDILLYKLKFYGITSKSSCLFESYLADRYQRVIINIDYNASFI